MANQSNYVTISISPDILKRTRETVTELNVLHDSFQKNNAMTGLLERGKKKKISQKIEDLTLKTFTEAALSYFIKAKIDPRFYQDSSIGSEINRLRNHILGFIVMQENKFIRPFQQDINGLKNELSSLKKELNEETIMVEATAMETQGTLMGLLAVLFEMLQIDVSERDKLEEMVQVKGIEYLKKLEQ